MKNKINFYSKLTKIYNLRSRAWFKINEINIKFNLIKKKNLILELGCYPGGWSQYIIEKKCFNIAIDIIDINSIKNCFFIKINLIKKNLLNKFLNLFKNKKFDLIISDACTKITGIKLLDKYYLNDLLKLNLKLINIMLKINGISIIKYFSFLNFNFNKNLNFKKFIIYKPKSSKKKSNEIYLILKNKLK